MPHIRNHATKEPGTLRMKKSKKEQLQNIISLRINDEEKKILEKLTKSTSKSISDVMREAIDLWSSQRHKVCTD
ncbi:MAG: CopG family transcriptional regulator [Desulfuromonadaceae bacterium GWB2_53_15]|nr:MAG: CopG family transcriptional regulator [Desulfuromonadales bacterium GWD2_54_10]OHB27347.1 MAG: CopG family transcriptional regulator [Desulfuromonadaceae bacterium GWB2_53_15]